ncbi:alpha/beta fold hydrolase [Agrobacterium tumefaciens]|uniref:alpha/beta fold hydrolase n=1 Tax=Agrobacterium tumefaciens TaxID=358 RepID=UPI0021D0EA7C|nr:alpha/beta hydrolase [Agrobacterium tumefaciens]UXS00690.1 alpha/beta hydrolase [Agrobacterium tumefaciens]
MPSLSEPVVLIHGLFGNLNDPEILAPFDGIDVHTPDLIGYGRYRDEPIENLTLRDQADHVAGHIRNIGRPKVHLVGHSVGGAVSALVCQHYPDMIASFTSVEGNFTLKDAFWSGQIAQKPDAEAAEIIREYEADPAQWIAKAGVPVNDWTLSLAKGWLANQPATTIKAQARAVVAATGHDDYLSGLRATMESGLPVYLVAGARSASGWDVADWANDLCRMRVNIPRTGHLMMAENPALFASTILNCLSCA